MLGLGKMFGLGKCLSGYEKATCARHIRGRVDPGAPGGPWAQIWCTRGERILHDRIHAEEALHGGLLAHSVVLGESLARGPWEPLGPDMVNTW